LAAKEMQKTQNLAVSSYPYLLITTNRGVGKFPLFKQSSWKIGRGKDNDIPLAGKSTSRHHAMLQATDSNRFLLIDLGSSNGSFINSRRVVKPTSLKNGDRITIGDTYIDFFCSNPNGYLTQDTTTSKVITEMLHKRCLITVLVVDIRNFTRLTQQLDEIVLSQMIGTWFRQAGEIISSYGSWVDKYIGDAVMSIWIHDIESEEESAEFHNSAGREMLQTFSALRELFIMSNHLNSKFDLPFTLRIGAGVNTGFAMVGQMGTSAHPDYTALGDTVNAAFRLESITKEINVDIALGQRTYEYIPNAHSLLAFKHQFVNLKGYDKRIATYAGNLEDLENFLNKVTPF
jgi:adenylate cyclase